DRTPIDLSAEMPENKSVFAVAYEQIARYLDGGALPDCTNDDFAAVHEVGFAAIESVNTGQHISIPNQRRDRLIFANG
ncbi:MAG: hypothetical protein HOH43_23630, partial [Candidatus Latescibacteria bacterium]|nr:hypothetical protein [Candidatus Latescibacterota bacterium]